MKTSILWNGFEIKKGAIQTSVGKIPYIFYGPEISTQPVNIAIHGEGHEKEDWLCFNSVTKFGNLLKESIKMNSPFLAFDLYGHGEWVSELHLLNVTNLSSDEKSTVINNSIIGIQEAIPQILQDEDLLQNKITITAYSIGCNVATGLNINKDEYKTILLSPFNSSVTSNCKEYLVFRGKGDKLVPLNEFNLLLKSLPEKQRVEFYSSKHEIPEAWINPGKKFIYS